MTGGPTQTAMQPTVTLVKWGGGLITDKSRPESIEQRTLARLATELADGLTACPQHVILGHGSGSFGHWSARDSFLVRDAPRHGQLSGDELESAAKTADAAARLHREVVRVLLETGLAPFSWLPSSAAYDVGGPASVAVSSLSESLRRGFVPVTGGDVVLSQARGAMIWSTEDVFSALVRTLPEQGWRVGRALWMGNTNGILDAEDTAVDRVDRDNHEHIAVAVSGSAGVDVTGGMRLRFDTCVDLAQRGVESWVLDGRSPGVLKDALTGHRSNGTRFVVQN